MLLFNIPFLDGTMAWTYYVRRNAGFFRASQRTARVCQRWLTKDEKRPDAEGRPECYAFGGSGLPLCSLPFWRLLAVVRRLFTIVLRLFTVVLRLFAVSLWLFAVVLRLLTFVLAVFHRRFTLMLRAPFSGGGGGLSAAKAHDDIPSVITAESKANFFIAISFLQMYRRISSGKSEDKMEKSLFGPLCIHPQTFSPAAVISRRNSRLMAASVSTLPPQSAISHSRRLGGQYSTHQ